MARQGIGPSFIRAGRTAGNTSQRGTPSATRAIGQATARRRRPGPSPAAARTPRPHGTQKPVECMRRPMLNNSTAGDAVYEPFLGSGTTLIAAESTGRVCFAMELDAAYVDVGIKRWQAFKGTQATLLVDGRTDEVASERPIELGPVARKEWDRLVAQLTPLRILTRLDRAALAACCGSNALWAEATEAIQ